MNINSNIFLNVKKIKNTTDFLKNGFETCFSAAT